MYMYCGIEHKLIIKQTLFKNINKIKNASHDQNQVLFMRRYTIQTTSFENDFNSNNNDIFVQFMSTSVTEYMQIFLYFTSNLTYVFLSYKTLIITTHFLIQCIRFFPPFLLDIVTSNFAVFTDRVKLQNFTTECFGDVSIAVNGIKYEVCYSDQDSIESRKKMGAMVCRELGCGEMLRVKKGSFTSNGFLSNVDCQGDERSLWHCLAIHEKKQCWGTKVICSGN